MGQLLVVHSPHFQHFRFKLKSFSILQFPFRLHPGIIFDFMSSRFRGNLLVKGLTVDADA